MTEYLEEKKEVNIEDFPREFQYGWVGLSEREYMDHVEEFLDEVPQKQRSLVVDLLDLQWVAYIQQLEFFRSETGNIDAGLFEVACVRLMLNEEIRRETNLPDRDISRDLHRAYEEALSRLPTNSYKGVL